MDVSFGLKPVHMEAVAMVVTILRLITATIRASKWTRMGGDTFRVASERRIAWIEDSSIFVIKPQLPSGGGMVSASRSSGKLPARMAGAKSPCRSLPLIAVTHAAGHPFD